MPALAALACLAFALLSLPAGADVAVYQSVVPIRGATAADKDAAFAEALKSAVVRATGRKDAGANPVVAAAAADPQRYVQQYSTTPDRYLKVGFDSGAIDRLIQQAGLPTWPLERPVTQVLLVLDSVAGGARAVVEGDRAPQKTEFELLARSRGLPIAWPRGTVDAGRVRAQVSANPASRGGGSTTPVLAGAGTAGIVSWRFSQPEQSVRAEGSLADGVDLAADSLASRFAPASTRSTSDLTVRVGGIGGVRAFAALEDYLQSLSLVRSLAVEEVTEDVVTLRLAVRGDLELLARVAAIDGRLKPAAATPGGEAAPAVDFTFEP